MALTGNHSGTAQNGQAATEFIIASVFLLVPLFLIIPVLGKYIDIKHAAIQQARFEAWEYTVWDGPAEGDFIIGKKGINSGEIAGIKDFTEPDKRRAILDTRHQGLNYFFSDPTAATYGTAGAAFQLNPLWKDHRGDSLFTGSSEIVTGSISEGPTPDGLRGIVSTILEVIGDVIGFIGDIMSFVGGDAKFDVIYPRGYFTSKVNVNVRSLDDILPQRSLGESKKESADPLEITATASVLTNGWNAGSRDNATAESRGLVVTAFLRPVSKTLNAIIAPINNFFNWFKKIPVVKITPPQLPGVPDFGYVQDDLIPLDHLDPDKEEIKDNNGLYEYE
ncbi:MAG: hypothetical protein M8357_12215 [Desulfobulbaceae bacterium]|nr:hypothetical protein [Desulfobulbaceae bacterium]